MRESIEDVSLMSELSTRGTQLVVLAEPAFEPIETVEHALREARDWQAETGASIAVEIMVAGSSAEQATGTQTKTRIEEAVAAFDVPEEIRTNVELLLLADEGPTRTDSLLDHLSEHIGDREPIRLVVGSQSEFEVNRLREQVGVTTVEIGPPIEPQERRRLRHPAGVRRLATIFSLTYLFYLAIGGFAGGLDLLTGAISASVVAASLSHVALREEPRLSRTVPRVARLLCFFPVLLWEIVKANLVIASVILHPQLPIDPSMGTMESDTSEGLERMVLANSITLTPGTLTIDVHGRTFVVHSLTTGGLADLEAGRLPRVVSWVFHGRSESGTAEVDGGESP